MHPVKQISIRKSMQLPLTFEGSCILLGFRVFILKHDGHRTLHRSSEPGKERGEDVGKAGHYCAVGLTTVPLTTTVELGLLTTTVLAWLTMTPFR